jgi:alpha-glucosidase (family GH31 glycosyl hydrolase)
MLMSNPEPGTPERLRLRGFPDECWWGGAVADGQLMPFGAVPHHRDLATSAGFVHDPEAGPNQSAPLLVSNCGRFVWSDHPFEFDVDGTGTLSVEGHDLVAGQSGSTLGEAFRAATSHFPPSGSIPPAEMFTAPQYNTWIEMPYEARQDAVLNYVRGLLDQGFPPGVVMIDDRWSVDYGVWRFDPAHVADPAAMIEQLHAWGCRVMLWLVPFISPDSATFRDLAARRLLVRDTSGEPVIRRWWNGYSAILDVTDPDAVQWLTTQLDALMDLGVHGFKFDAGDLRDYRPDDVTTKPGGPVVSCEAWAQLGLRYRFNEYRACWKMGGQPLAQRLHDKPAAWGAGGLGSLIPDCIAQGLIGHAFVCPDMVGGGDLASFTEGGAVDQEFFVRYAQCAALLPIMQFSVSPARVLDDVHLKAVLEAVRLHQSLADEILDLARHAATTGEPIVRHLAYHHPGYEDVSDHFLLGENLLCAPILEQGATTRRVSLPPGRWRDPAGTVLEGGQVVTIPVDLMSVPAFRRVS